MNSPCLENLAGPKRTRPTVPAASRQLWRYFVSLKIKSTSAFTRTGMGMAS